MDQVVSSGLILFNDLGMDNLTSTHVSPFVLK